ncbi:hypothetical protein K0M31_002981 [Melipona bicolor]|uniref:Ig-like domain-containing protein n=1 Tax=Melipona bicolor TaxID=60889 RepID=A0AA40G0A0_9HYME|nr:hypothetical protein K0M31_002981 [Melipona bicolor]
MDQGVLPQDGLKMARKSSAPKLGLRIIYLEIRLGSDDTGTASSYLTSEHRPSRPLLKRHSRGTSSGTQAQNKQNVFQGSATVYQVHVRTLLCVGLSESMCTNARGKERRNLSEIVTATANFQHSGKQRYDERRSFVTRSCDIVAIIITYDPTRGGVSVVTEKGDITRSFLLVQEAKPSDSGRYTCNPSNAQSKSITVHVLNGE